MAGSIFFGFAQVIAQSTSDISPGWMEVIKQGGFLAALLIVLFFYRKDFLSKDDSRKEEKQQLLDVIKNNTEATQAQTVALEQMKASNDRLSRAIEVTAFQTELKHGQSRIPKD